MIRKLNYTGRKRIPKSEIEITLVLEGGGRFSFDAEIYWDELELPKDADVYIEAYHRTSYMRFHLGKIGKISIPSDRSLSLIEPGSIPLFRVKVVRDGRIVASADKIVPRTSEDEPKGKISLLPVEFKDLEDLVWHLEMSGDRPVLQLNNRIDGIREVARNNAFFFALVYPAVIRRIFEEIMLKEEGLFEDEEEWQMQWIQFAKSLPGVGEPPLEHYPGAEADREDWIDRAVKSFCGKWKVRESFQRALDED